MASGYYESQGMHAGGGTCLALHVLWCNATSWRSVVESPHASMCLLLPRHCAVALCLHMMMSLFWQCPSLACIALSVSYTWFFAVCDPSVDGAW